MQWRQAEYKKTRLVQNLHCAFQKSTAEMDVFNRQQNDNLQIQTEDRVNNRYESQHFSGKQRTVRPVEKYRGMKRVLAVRSLKL
jgi:hypothetical protein